MSTAVRSTEAEAGAEALPAGRGSRVDALRLLAGVLALVGVGIATYLTYIHYSGDKPLCTISHGCEVVQHSSYSKLLGVPVALLGLIGYVSLVGAIAVDGEDGRLAAVAITWGGLAFSAYLTFREIFTIDAICIWCVGSALVMTASAVVNTVRFLRSS